jgi:hypothetical protein
MFRNKLVMFRNKLVMSTSRRDGKRPKRKQSSDAITSVFLSLSEKFAALCCVLLRAQ